MSELDPTSSRTPAKTKTTTCSSAHTSDLNLQQSPRNLKSPTQRKICRTKKRQRGHSESSMLSTSSSKVTAACVALMMMMMMMTMTMQEAAAMPKVGGQSKHSGKTHKKSSEDVAVETVPLQLDSSALVPAKIIRPLENASISPWTYNVTHDESLFPPMLSEAHCLLQGCLDSNGQEDFNLESRPIMHQVLLLRRVRSAGSTHSYHYRLESRLITVGCTCVRPVIQRQE